MTLKRKTRRTHLTLERFILAFDLIRCFEQFILRFLQEFDARLKMSNRLRLLFVFLRQITVLRRSTIVVHRQVQGELTKIILSFFNELNEGMESDGEIDDTRT